MHDSSYRGMVNYVLARSEARKLAEDIPFPPVPVYEIAKKFASVVWMVSEVDGVDAICVRSKTEYRLFVEVDSKVPERVRFSTGHEVAHIVLGHHNRLKEIARRKKIKLGRTFFYWDDIPELAPYVKAFDREANIFASELLMPKRWLRRPRTVDEFEEMRRKLEVTRPALAIRLDETGIMKREEVEELLRNR